jgi:tRNA nucleotidyltransferase (CCA-adding enzyme)
MIGRSKGDKDYVVVGATEKDLLDKGFKKVGKDFPVFLHPQTGEEYAMARKEIKISQGHDGFKFDFSAQITLKEDLIRRDLTINAMAQDLDTGEIIDPYQGQIDLKNKILRHVGPHFVEDPLRVLRVARFKAQLDNFNIAEETLNLMREICLSGELQTLSGERIYMELKKGLLSNSPSLFIKVLDEVDALKIIFPEIYSLKNIPQKKKYHPEGDSFTHTLLVLENSAQLSNDLDIRFSCLVHDLGKALTPTDVLPSHKGHEKAGLDPIKNLCQRLRVPKKTKELALKVCEFHLLSHKARELRPSTILKLFKSLDVFRNEDILERFLICCHADDLGKLSHDYPQKNYLMECFQASKAVNAKKLAQTVTGKEVGEKIDLLRIEEIKKVKTNFVWPGDH